MLVGRLADLGVMSDVERDTTIAVLFRCFSVEVFDMLAGPEHSPDEVVP